MSNDNLILSTWQRLRSRLGVMATRITGSDEQAQDALQDAFVSLWTHRERLHGTPAAIEGVSVVTVRNASITATRRERVRRTQRIDDLPVQPATPAADGAHPEQLLAQVREIMANELTQQQRAIVQMHELQGLTTSEIAQELGMQPGAVRAQLSRTRKRIREIYRNKYGNEQE